MAREKNEPDPEDAALILIIDDDPEVLTFLDQLLREAGYRTLSAEDGPMGLALARKYEPNVILLDLQMPGMDGYAVCQELKARRATTEIPVIIITASERSDEILSRCFELGASDFINKPFSRVDLRARIQVVLREQELRETYRRIATQDLATGLTNRRQFVDDIKEALDTTDRDSAETILILADIDGMSRTNDRFGHDLGDELILTFARLLKRFISPDCEVARIGGDEFGILLTHSSKERGLALTQRLRHTFAAIVFDANRKPAHFTANFGITCYDGDPTGLELDVFLGQADIALCAGKETGRNQIVAYWQLDPSSLSDVPPHQRHARAKARGLTHRAFIGVVDGQASQPKAAGGEGQRTKDEG
jgi:diguanylate cyclase (GGDEF)-like protein